MICVKSLIVFIIEIKATFLVFLILSKYLLKKIILKEKLSLL